jgi:hypothetical protein
VGRRTTPPPPRCTFVLDIETLGTAGSLPAVVEMARAADKDPATFAALSPALAHVVCVGLKHLETGREMALVDLKPFGEDAVPFGEQMQGFGGEADMLRRANELLGKAAALVTFNGRSFDIPVLVHRMVAHEITPCAFLLRCARQPRYKGAEPHCDLREQFTFQGACNGAGTSLRAFAIGYGLADPKAGGDGAHVGDLVAEGKVDELVRYCLGDVRTTASLYERWASLAGVA